MGALHGQPGGGAASNLRAAVRVKHLLPLIISVLIALLFIPVNQARGVAAGAGGEVTTGAVKDYFWTWYDNVYARNWVLMSNPASAAGHKTFELTIAGQMQDLTSFRLDSSTCLMGRCAAGQVPSGMSITPIFQGVMDGPVKASSLTGDDTIVSQRILWNGDSLEEVPGVGEDELSDHFYWPWYDQNSPGYTDWVLLANPGQAEVYFEITIAGQDPGAGSSGTIAPGEYVAPQFAGKIGGPVEARAWTNSTKTAPALILASQRVLSDYGRALNEMPGIPESQLCDSYIWTWYDAQGSNGKDWVMIANPHDVPIYYEITVGGGNPGPGSTGTIGPGACITPVFPGWMGGPLTVGTWTDATRQVVTTSIASQRTIWGSSFEEVPGYAQRDLAPNYHWTWYDQRSAGATNWVLVANPNSYPLYYEVTIGGQLAGQAWNGIIAPGANVAPTFPNRMDGPVEVMTWRDSTRTQPANSMTSQRVLWNGHFNEVPGTALKAYNLQSQAVDMRVVGSLHDSSILAGADGLDVAGQFAYVVSGGSNDLSIVDISNPAAPVLTANLTDSLGRLDRAWGISVSGNYAYVAAGYMGNSHRLTIVDISDPSHPVITGSVQDDMQLAGALHVFIAGQYAYVTAPQANRLTIVDIADPANPRVVGSLRDDIRLFAVDGVSVAGNFAFATSHQLDGGTDKSYLSAIDITDPAHPHIAGALNSAFFRGGDQMDIQGNHLFVTGNLDHTFSVVDIADPAAMRILSHITDDTFIGQSAFVDAAGSYAYLTSANTNRLTMVDISDLSSPRIVGSVQDSLNLKRALYVKISGNHAYVTSPAGALTVVEIGGLNPGGIGDMARP